MGADGTLYLMRRTKWNKEWGDLDPTDCNIYPSTILGIDIVKVYIDSERDGGDYGKTDLAENEVWCQREIKLVDERGDGETYTFPDTRHLGRFGSRGRTIVKAEVQAKLAKMIEDVDALSHSRVCKAAMEWFFEQAEKETVWT